MDWMDLEDGSPERVAEELVTWQQTFSWQWFATKKVKSVKLEAYNNLLLMLFECCALFRRIIERHSSGEALASQWAPNNVSDNY